MCRSNGVLPVGPKRAYMQACRGASCGCEMRVLIALALIVLLAGCAGRSVTVREPVEVVRYVYVRIDPALTEPLPIANGRTNKGKELLRVSRERRAALEVCNGRLGNIRAIEGTEVKP